MSKFDFSAEEFLTRQTRVREAIAAEGLDCLLVFHPVSIHWLTGSDAKSYQEFQCLIVTAKPGPLIIATREGERAEYQDTTLVDVIRTHGGGHVEDPIPFFLKVLAEFGLTKSRIGMEVPAYYLHPHHYTRIREQLGPAVVAEPTDLIANLKLVKSPAELEYIRRAAQIADEGMQSFAAALREGKSELELAGEVYKTLLTRGSGLAASPINLVSGERSGFSHGAPTERQLRKGDFGSIEYGATWRRYTSTIGRQFCLGRPSSRMQAIYDAVCQASDACFKAIRPGVPATVPHQAARQVIVHAGLERGRVHTSGYGLAPGFPPTWGEPLHLLDVSSYTLQVGMVITIEPPVFLDDERLGARIIDNVVVTENGAELLSRFSRELIIVDD